MMNFVWIVLVVLIGAVLVTAAWAILWYPRRGKCPTGYPFNWRLLVWPPMWIDWCWNRHAESMGWPKKWWRQ